MLFDDVCTWKVDRNPNGATVDWCFMAADARIKLKKLNPTIYPIEMLKNRYISKHD
jgi:hypothetical protein